MDAISVAAITATRQTPTPSADTPLIPPTDLLVLHSAARLSLYVASRHVCDIRLTVPSLDNSLSPYLGFLRGSHAVPPKEAESPGGALMCASNGDHHNSLQHRLGACNDIFPLQAACVTPECLYAVYRKDKSVLP